MTLSILKTFSTEDEMLNYSANLAKCCTPKTTIFLRGELGVGKTTFVRGFLKGLGYKGVVKSPTYTWVEPYFFDHFDVFHFDLYRLENPLALLDIGYKEYWTDQSICLVEWPEKSGTLLPPPNLSCDLEFLEQGRALHLKAEDRKGVLW